MASLFSRSANTKTRIALIALFVIIVGVPTLLMLWMRTPYITGAMNPITQPVNFDHRHHAVDDGINCVYCHSTVERSPYAGVPATEVCMGCHNQIWANSPQLEPVRRSYLENRPIPWQRVNRVPDFVYFDHSIHVNKGVGCETCHGRVDQMARVYQAEPLTMGWCLNCHRHPEAYLRPVDEVTTMGWRPDRPQSELRRELRKLYNVQSLTYCTTCHR